MTLLHKDFVAVSGQIKERYPFRNWYHFIAHLEWGARTGNIPYFGGIVLIEKGVLEKVGGYNSHLIAGEDPELAFRLVQANYKINSSN